MTIDSLGLNQNTGVANTPPATTTSWAAKSRSTGRTSPRTASRRRPADPLFTGTFDNPNFAAVNPDYNQDLLMKPG